MASNAMPAFPQLQFGASAIFPTAISITPHNLATTLTNLAKVTKQMKFPNNPVMSQSHHHHHLLQNAQQPMHSGHWTGGDPINLALNHQQQQQQQCMQLEMSRAVKSSQSKKSKKAANHQHHNHQNCQCCDVTEKPHLCDFPGCGKRFRQKPHLQAHKNIHSGRRFNCQWVGCGKSFVRKYNLVEHQKMHSPVQTNMCTYPECGKVFSSKYSLVRHQNAQHSLQLAA